MDTLILILLGLIAGLLVSKSRYPKVWDIIMGTLGALAANSIIGVLYGTFSLLAIMAGSVIIIHLGRILQN